MRAERLGRVFEDRHLVGGASALDGVEVGALPREVNDDDGLGELAFAGALGEKVRVGQKTSSPGPTPSSLRPR